MYELFEKQTEIIEDLVKLDKLLINLLSQFTDAKEYERELKRIIQNNDVIR